MEIYERLQLDAARKRDSAYVAARREYSAALRNIRELGNAKPTQPRKTMAEIIQEVLPRDTTFTVAAEDEGVTKNPSCCLES